ncbi:MAG TPA: glycoside hydrolase family 3 N-terminal domain-containing protein [Ignavibacteriales bacterium]|nr:glycoside hydrolase family 3 N-terminal domain-containing protein [Ignavibacteriales bacterium]
MNKIFSLLLSITVLLSLSCTAHAQGSTSGDKSNIYHSGWIDLNKNGVMDPYENSKLPIEERVKDLLGRMTLEEKTCQMATLYGYGRVLKDELPNPSWLTSIWKDGIANIDEHLNGYDGHHEGKNADTELAWPPSRHAEAINTVQKFFIEQTRLGIPVDFTNEGIRGVCHTGGTLFPADIATGSSWDVSLVSKIGHITGKEARILGYTNIYSPILDLARDPRWGRTVETYGEDPYLVSRIGVAQVEGLQKEGVVSTAKHFAVYSVPKGGRDGASRTDPHVTQREVEDIYLAPFKAAFTEGHAMGTMSSYNDYNGVPVTGSSEFLTKKLRQEYGFKGYVVSDSRAVEYIFNKHHVAKDAKDAVCQSVMAGLNVRTDFTPPEDFILPLRELVKEGSVPDSVLNARVSDVLRVKFWLGLFDHPYVENPALADKIVGSEVHLKAAKDASYESMVLLKNANNFLPLKKNIKSILVTGPMADVVKPNISRYGPNRVDVVSVLRGLKEKLPNVEVRYTKGCDVVDSAWPESEIMPRELKGKDREEIDKAAEMAKGVDAAVVVLGEDEKLTGEFHSRTSLDLPGYQLDLVKAIYETGTPVIVVLMNGRPLSINWVNRYVPAIIETWYPGRFGGNAVADIIFGDYNPGGKLPITFPKTVGQLPLDFPYKPASDISDPTGIQGVLYPFGHGLSFTTFKYSNLKVTPEEQTADDEVKVSFEVENTGPMAGDEVPQLYINDETASVTTYVKNLRGFQRINLKPGEKKLVEFTLKPEDLTITDRNMKRVVEPGKFNIMVGSSSEDIRLNGSFEIK